MTLYCEVRPEPLGRRYCTFLSVSVTQLQLSELKVKGKKPDGLIVRNCSTSFSKCCGGL